MEQRHRIALAIIPGLVGLMFALDPGMSLFLRASGGAVFVLVLVASLYAFVSPVMQVFARAVTAIVPIGGVAIGLVVLIQPYFGDNEETFRIVAGAVVIASGWVVGFVTSELRRVDEREERRRDLTIALIAEIRVLVKLHSKPDWADMVAEAQAEFDAEIAAQDAGEDHPPHLPFVSFIYKTTVLRRVIDEIEALDEDQIDDVYMFFDLIERIQQVAERLDTEGYKTLSPERRKTVYVGLLKMHGTVVQAGERTLNALGVDWKDALKAEADEDELS